MNQQQGQILKSFESQTDIQILQEKHQFKGQQRQMNIQIQEDNINHQQLCQIIIKLFQRVIYRQFIKKLIFTYIQSLKYSQQKQFTYKQSQRYHTKKQITNWPFKQLYQLKYKTPDQLILLEFVNMCATKIQSFFKGYITYKRHKYAYRKLKIVEQKLKAMLLFWKTKKIFCSKKIKQIKDKIKEINTQIVFEQQSPNRSSKRLQYLYDDYQHHIQLFQIAFNKLYSTGTWVFEVDINSRPKMPKKINHPIKNQQQPIKPIRRKRQFSTNMQEKNKIIQKQQSHKLIQQSIQTIDQHHNQFLDKFDQRPIKTKGNYLLDLDLDNISTNFSTTNNQKKQKNNQDKKQNDKNKNQSGIDQKKKIQNKQQLKKLQKRQKYDPRKAIAQQKLKKQAKKTQPTQIEKKQVRETIQTVSVIQTQQNNRKTVKQNKVVNKSTTLTNKNINTNKIKPKVQSKVQCWNKKFINNSSQLINNHQFTKFTNIIKQQPQTIQQQSQKISTPINNSDQYRLKLQQILKRQLKNKSQIQDTKPYQQIIQNHQKQQKYKRLNTNMQKILQKLSDNKKKQIYKSVQQLQKAYNSQYTKRFQDLMPKLGLVSAARRDQQGKGIPVLNQKQFYLKKQLTQQFLIDSSFWQSISKMQKQFKQFITN